MYTKINNKKKKKKETKQFYGNNLLKLLLICKSMVTRYINAELQGEKEKLFLEFLLYFV